MQWRTSFLKLREEQEIVSVLDAFLQHDLSLAQAVLLKIDTLVAALESSSFFRLHVFLRSSLLLVYDSKERSSVEFRMTSFGFSYAIPAIPGQADLGRVTHVDPWDGTEASHEDGYLTGVDSLCELWGELAARQAGPP